jgi:hypothetical protein
MPSGALGASCDPALTRSVFHSGNSWDGPWLFSARRSTVVEHTMDMSGWLRKQLEDAHPDLLRAMVKEMAEALIAETSQLPVADQRQDCCRRRGEC